MNGVMIQLVTLYVGGGNISGAESKGGGGHGVPTHGNDATFRFSLFLVSHYLVG